MRTVELAVILCLLCLNGCLQDMWNGSRYKPLSSSPAFVDGRSSRPLMEDTVSRTDAVAPTPFTTGMDVEGKPVTRFPTAITRQVLDRGQQRFNIYCSPCHGRLGDGKGMIVQRGFSPPPSYHIPRLRNVGVGHFFDVITHGYGAMYSYNDRVNVPDRWAIAAYIRVLQRSQYSVLTDAPPDAQRELMESRP